ncbi:6-carboxyhexanoate--CoA ligase [Corynebacterium sp. ES2794-CONJ1]|uniref:6-carboxyhexanoate--CoA ligase n=1 Tax=unclassified Corynebacterium TaxID=2624378 RepID=UPI0021671883|nr:MULTISPECIES: 6-carboxyhexanoate--CoA ligase [unclassified Corynebacterium]MCS4490740.1 6-carboxyhexanoate--CoA ligase [Corynebacterium sp. ES2775-CONJ]MCS4492542.1 6-carboxyhexanoate--CoA ligase [Corynebacterium sp. ES2715-CONJ3]MCS4532643.1 6-carboxyhexanoate--CoA ligase [Corynebacterium sp. ES2730-CONJ]MCU9520038.1 6-carboxyhexanoate--CoA ligase [Corynebacterium sp. ES2794-CONJ1]
MAYYSIRMHASNQGTHISGAERLTNASARDKPSDITQIAADLIERALTHPKAEPDSISLRVERLDQDPLRVPLLPCVELPAGTSIAELLTKNGLSTSAAELAQDLIFSIKDMRGAALLDARRLRRIEPDRHRGIRVSTFDYEHTIHRGSKNHHVEARILATKTLSAPGVVAELCMSDDPDYTTGYIALAGTYYRIPNMKKNGSGGRVIIVDSTQYNFDLGRTIAYLEDQPVLVTGHFHGGHDD